MKKICEIKGYEEVRPIYFIREDGAVISYGNYGSSKIGAERELYQAKKTGGYLNVGLMMNGGKTKWFRVHRIVASAFIDNPSDKIYVNHKDCNRRNNKAENLEWVTPKENNLHSLAKAVYAYKINGTYVKKYAYASLCKEDGFNQGHVCAVARGDEKSHKGHIFSYIELNINDVVQRLSKAYPRTGYKRVEYTQASGNMEGICPKI